MGTIGVVIVHDCHLDFCNDCVVMELSPYTRNTLVAIPVVNFCTDP